MCPTGAYICAQQSYCCQCKRCRVGESQRSSHMCMRSWRIVNFKATCRITTPACSLGLRNHLQVWVDTVGWPMPYPLVWLAGCKVAAYVHYPTISTDMLARVRGRTLSFNNTQAISTSRLRTALKMAYYRLFALLYGFLGAFPSVVLVNSSWTKGHIAALWWRWRASKPQLVYPPCDVAALMQMPLDRRRKPLHFCSIAQFRPEKDHMCAVQC